MTKLKQLFPILFTLSLLLSLTWLQMRPKKQVLYLGTYTGSSWDVPNGQDNDYLDDVIKRFEEKYPLIDVVYESGIPKEDYSDWLAEKLITGQDLDVFMVTQEDFNLLVSSDSLMDLTAMVKEGKISTDYYPSALLAGQYQTRQYTLPLEANPTLLCVNQELLQKEGISLPKEPLTLSEFYQLCHRLTKDTDGDGSLDQFGLVSYTWQDALLAYGSDSFSSDGEEVLLNSQSNREALAFYTKLSSLTKQMKVTSDDFDQGKVAFMPMTLAQYRTYKPYPYHIAKYSNFSWTCVQMPKNGDLLNTSKVAHTLVGISAKTKKSALAWQFLNFLSRDPSAQEWLMKKSQGMSVLPKVVESDAIVSLLKADKFGSDALSVTTLSQLEMSAYSLPKFKNYQRQLEKADYLVTQALENDTIDTELVNIQKELERSQ